MIKISDGYFHYFSSSSSFYRINTWIFLLLGWRSPRLLVSRASEEDEDPNTDGGRVEEVEIEVEWLDLATIT